MSQTQAPPLAPGQAPAPQGNPPAEAAPSLDLNQIEKERRAKLQALRAEGIAYPNQVQLTHFPGDLQHEHQPDDAAALQALDKTVSVAGRMMLKRIMGKASFCTLADTTGEMQLFVRVNDIGEALYEKFKHFDLGDIITARGKLFRTKTGELSVHVESLQLLSKSLRPLPDKFLGLSDTETRYRQRYVDLIVNADSRHVFIMRSKIISAIRSFMDAKRFMEVETPMMHYIPGGAAARPFKTHHNALDLDLYLRVAPELYLKRLTVGGFDRVYEINRNFRNEGVSTRHNPEFTMMEFYWAYATYIELMQITEELFAHLAITVHGAYSFTYDNQPISFQGPFQKLRLEDAVRAKIPGMTAQDCRDVSKLRSLCQDRKIRFDQRDGWGKLILALFEEEVEALLIQPTFITHYPIEVSPLSRRNDDDPELTDRFELFITGREIANGFSELNDPEDQAERFRAQVAEKDAGNDEAMHFDADYIRALEYGMAPTAGEGIGIDRLVMMLTNSLSIRDVLLFPYMRPEVM